MEGLGDSTDRQTFSRENWELTLGTFVILANHHPQGNFVTQYRRKETLVLLFPAAVVGAPPRRLEPKPVSRLVELEPTELVPNGWDVSSLPPLAPDRVMPLKSRLYVFALLKHI